MIDFDEAKKDRERIDAYAKAMNEYGIPEYMHGGVVRYVLFGILPGHFLSAVVASDLFGAVAHADDANEKVLKGYVMFFYNHAPGGCWGSKERVEAWAKKGGLIGKKEAA